MRGSLPTAGCGSTSASTTTTAVEIDLAHSTAIPGGGIGAGTDGGVGCGVREWLRRVRDIGLGVGRSVTVGL